MPWASAGEVGDARQSPSHWSASAGSAARIWNRGTSETTGRGDERIARLARLRHGELKHNSDLYTDREKKVSPAYNELLRDTREPERPSCAPGRPAGIQHRVEPGRLHRTRGLVLGPDRDDFEPSAAHTPIRAHAAGAGRFGRAGQFARRFARQHSPWRHPSGPARTDRGGERPRGRPPATRRRVGGRGRLSQSLHVCRERQVAAIVGAGAAATRYRGFGRLDDAPTHFESGRGWSSTSIP